MRRRFEAALGEAVRDNIVLLGVSFKGARNRAMTSKEQSPIQRATNIACKASVLLDYCGKLHVVTQRACSDASWGWIFCQDVQSLRGRLEEGGPCAYEKQAGHGKTLTGPRRGPELR